MSDDFTIELACCDMVLLQDVAIPETTRNGIATTYAMAICSSWPTDWKKVNEAIMARWSRSGLIYIKTRAWKMIEEKRKAVRK